MNYTTSLSADVFFGAIGNDMEVLTIHLPIWDAGGPYHTITKG